MRQVDVLKVESHCPELAVWHSQKEFVAYRLPCRVGTLARPRTRGHDHGFRWPNFPGNRTTACIVFTIACDVSRVPDIRKVSRDRVQRMPVKFLIADDHEVSRSRLADLLNGHSGWEVCAAVENG